MTRWREQVGHASTASAHTDTAVPYLMDDRHALKRVNFLGRDVSVVLQNENGPCPLLGICT